jgi:Mg2+-importing ATPase
VLFVIRTIKRPWRDRPSTPLAATTIGVVVLGIILPFTPLGSLLGFVPLPATFLLFLVAVAAGYLVVVELVKGRVMRTLSSTGVPTASPLAAGNVQGLAA